MKKTTGGLKSKSLDDARARFKHQSLLQDYQELEKETEVARNRLRSVKDRKLTLEAEVRFLRRRYNFLLKSRAQSHQPKQDVALPQPPKLKPQSRNTVRATNNNATKGAMVRPPVPKFEASPKGRVLKKKAVTPPAQKLSFSIDLNQNITNYNAQESTSRNPVHQLDLNQIANDEDEFQPSFEPIRIEASAFVKGLTDDQLNEMKLSACRAIGDAAASGRSGKRKISWQDQVALRV
uniref:Uncharacterized protein n=1 Tax=Kalanchoe fedtschenkoi TaxID=63787 RepID=A0A7N0V427_KALFE